MSPFTVQHTHFQQFFKLLHVVHTCHRRSVVGSVLRVLLEVLAVKTFDLDHTASSEVTISKVAAETATSQEIRVSEEAHAFFARMRNIDQNKSTRIFESK